MKNFSNKINRSIGLCMAFSAILGGCAKFETRELFLDKPQSIINQEALDAYGELKTYVDYSNQPNFKLGAELSLSDVQNNSLLYRLVQRHFDEISFTRSLNHMDFVHPDGTIQLDNFQNALEVNDSVGMPVHAGHLVWHEKQQADYLNKLIAPVVLPGQSGSDVVVNFEGDAIGTTYPTTTTAASATVVADPTGKSGNTLRILKTTGTAFPQFTITLPAGRKLGNYKSVAIDFKAGGSFGLYGAGMRMAITSQLGNPSLTGYGSPASFGVGDNVWGRGLIILPIANLNLTAQQKELTSFVLTIGSQTGSADYLIDNVTMNWEIPGQTIVKTPEEKAAIIKGELEKWIKAVAEAGKNRIKSWSVVYQPMDELNPTELRSGNGNSSLPANTFYWQDYLGKDYAAIAIELLKQYANAQDKVFFTETNLVDNPSKIQGLAQFISYTEGKGQQVDGIATELALDISTDKTKLETMLQGLAATGKLVKISALDIGVGVSTSQATAELYQQQAEMYKWVVQAYLRLVPAAQRAGITFRSPVDQSSSSSWRPNEPVGLWTGTTSYLRKPAYVGVAEALKDK